MVEMLLQHILTKDIFLRVFSEDQFHRENNIALQLEALEQTFFTGDVRREAIERLRTYYGAIGRAADDIADYAEKQKFLKAVYQDFYKTYNPKAADRLGVVYTPNEVVDFMVRGTDYLLQKHFGRSLADENVQILDPASGTGTFVTGLIDYLPVDRLEYKYRNEIHANEVAILPYYIANLNIEYSYKEKMGRYLEFANLCFVDTLDNLDWQQSGATGGAVTRQAAFNIGAVSEENWMRVQEQNEKTISVIIGNPPYNANQQNENDNNKNREYYYIDRRIKETYIQASTAQKTKQYDMYKRFIRWASDRLADVGIIAFVTNRAYLDARQDDGFRKIVLDEFNAIYIVDLGGNFQKGQGLGNVFGIRIGVAIVFLLRHSERQTKGTLHYYALEDAQTGSQKLSSLTALSLDSIAFDRIVPDWRGDWLDQTDNSFEGLIPVANRETKTAKTRFDESAVFGLYTLGVITARDEWVYDFSSRRLEEKVCDFIDTYEHSRADHGGSDVDASALDIEIKWTRDLKHQLRLNVPNKFDRYSLCETMFRPFTKKWLYFNQNLNEMQYQLPSVFPRSSTNENLIICIKGPAANYSAVLATDTIVNEKFAGTNDGNTFCLPLYRYTEDGERVSNVTQWAIKEINEHYRKELGEEFYTIYPDGGINAEDIFAYTYAVLHDPVYREKYAVDLLREFPRLPFYEDFWGWAASGQELLDLHIGFEAVEPYGLKRNDQSGEAKRVILRADKERGVITLDDKTTLTGVPADAWRYVLGNRSALEWVLDQYKEKKYRR